MMLSTARDNPNPVRPVVPHHLGMEGRLAAVAATQGGVILRRQALECGYDSEEVKRQVRRGEWIRIRRGAYVRAADASGTDETGRHLQRVHAVVAAAATPLVVSGVSACLLHGLDLWRPDLNRVQVTHPGVAARVEGDVHHHDAFLGKDEITVVDGLAVTSLARTVVDTARVSDFEQGVALTDSALRTCLTSSYDIRKIFDRCAQWPGSRNVARTLGSGDGRAQNVAESRTRVALLEGGLPEATPQVFLYDECGRLLGIVDMALLGHHVVVEFDGRMKYGIDGKDPRVQVFNEKVRGDGIQRVGWVLERVIWSDLGRRRDLVARVRSAVDRGLSGPPPRGFYRLGVATSTGIVPVGPHRRCGEGMASATA